MPGAQSRTGRFLSFECAQSHAIGQPSPSGSIRASLWT